MLVITANECEDAWGIGFPPLSFFFFKEAPLHCSCLVHFQASAPRLAYLTLQVKLNSQTGSWTATLGAHQPRPIHFSSREVGWGCPWSGAILRERSLEQSPAWQEMDSVVQPQKERHCHGGSESWMSEQRGTRVDHVPACCPLSVSFRELPTWLAMIAGFSMILTAQSMQAEGDSSASEQGQKGTFSPASKSPGVQRAKRKVMLSCAQRQVPTYLNNANKQISLLSIFHYATVETVASEGQGDPLTLCITSQTGSLLLAGSYRNALGTPLSWIPLFLLRESLWRTGVIFVLGVLLGCMHAAC